MTEPRRYTKIWIENLKWETSGNEEHWSERMDNIGNHGEVNYIEV